MQEHTNFPAPRKSAPLEGQSQLSYKGSPVLTTELAAKAFGVDEAALRKNYERNRDRFEDGKHLFRIEGAALRSLKDSVSFRGSVGANAKSLTLWTERGIARHAKILETETAWAIFEDLEDTYFRARAERTSGGSERQANADVVRIAKAREARLSFNGFLKICRMIGVTGNHAVLSADGATREMTGVSMLGLLNVPRLEADIGGAQITVTDIGRAVGLSARDTNRALIDHGFQTAFRDAKGRIVYEPTDKGRENGGRMAATGKRHHNGTPVTQLVWSTATTEALKSGMQGSLV